MLQASSNTVQGVSEIGDENNLLPWFLLSFLAATWLPPRPTFGHYRGTASFTRRYSLRFYNFDPKATRGLVWRSLSSAEHLVGFEPRAFRF